MICINREARLNENPVSYVISEGPEFAMSMTNGVAEQNFNASVSTPSPFPCIYLQGEHVPALEMQTHSHQTESAL